MSTIIDVFNNYQKIGLGEFAKIIKRENNLIYIDAFTEIKEFRINYKKKNKWWPEVTHLFFYRPCMFQNKSLCIS
jgi:hypothetical protein